MKPGIMSTELYVVLAVLVPWISAQLGVDLSAVFNDPDNISAIIKSAQEGGNNAPVYVALAYVLVRGLLKWKQ